MLTLPSEGGAMLDDLRKTIEATIGELTPARAKSLAKSLAGPGAAKDQVAKSASDLVERSQKNRDQINEVDSKEAAGQGGGAVGISADLHSHCRRGTRQPSREGVGRRPEGLGWIPAGRGARSSGARRPE